MTSEVLSWELDKDEIWTHPPRCFLGGRVLRSRRDVSELDAAPVALAHRAEPSRVRLLIRVTTAPACIADAGREGGNDRPCRELRHAGAGLLSERLSEQPCHRVGRYLSAAPVFWNDVRASAAEPARNPLDDRRAHRPCQTAKRSDHHHGTEERRYHVEGNYRRDGESCEQDRRNERSRSSFAATKPTPGVHLDVLARVVQRYVARLGSHPLVKSKPTTERLGGSSLSRHFEASLKPTVREVNGLTAVGCASVRE